MNVGIIGSGGREHAICFMLNKSKKASKIFCFPGNAGTSLIAQNVNLDPDNFSELEKYCVENDIKMLVVGPEKQLVNGIVDHLKVNLLECLAQIKYPQNLKVQKFLLKKFVKKRIYPHQSLRFVKV